MPGRIDYGEGGQDLQESQVYHTDVDEEGEEDEDANKDASSVATENLAWYCSI